MDHKSLKYVLTQKNPSRRLTRFIDDLSHFNVRIIYRPGRCNVVSDSLSRIPHTSNKDDALPYRPLHSNIMELYITSGESSPSAPAHPADPLFDPASETEEDHIKLYNAVFENLERYREDLVNNADPASVGTGHYFQVNNKLFKDISEDEDKQKIVAVPTSLDAANEVIRLLHQDIGHLGITATVATLKKRIWTPYLEELVRHNLHTCKKCQFNRREPTATLPLHPMPRPEPTRIWAFDFIGPLPKTRSGNAYILS
jgi:hypothetical protein